VIDLDDLSPIYYSIVLFKAKEKTYYGNYEKFIGNGKC